MALLFVVCVINDLFEQTCFVVVAVVVVIQLLLLLIHVCSTRALCIFRMLFSCFCLNSRTNANALRFEDANALRFEDAVTFMTLENNTHATSATQRKLNNTKPTSSLFAKDIIQIQEPWYWTTSSV